MKRVRASILAAVMAIIMATLILTLCLSSCGRVPRRGRLIDLAQAGGRYRVTAIQYERGTNQAMVSLQDATGTGPSFRWYSFAGGDWHEMPMIGVQRPVGLIPRADAVSPTNAPSAAVFTPAPR